MAKHKEGDAKTAAVDNSAHEDSSCISADDAADDYFKDDSHETPNALFNRITAAIELKGVPTTTAFPPPIAIAKMLAELVGRYQNDVTEAFQMESRDIGMLEH